MAVVPPSQLKTNEFAKLVGFVKQPPGVQLQKSISGRYPNARFSKFAQKKGREGPKTIPAQHGGEKAKIDNAREAVLRPTCY